MFLSMRPQLRGKYFCVAAIALAAIPYSSKSFALPLAVGAIEQVDLKSSSIVVLGQHFHVSASTLITSQTSYPTAVSLAALPQNALVWVDGEEKASGSTHVDALIVLPESNVPGASQLSLTGVVSSVSSDGQIRVGELKVDINQTLSSGGARVAVGDTVEISGTQPTAQGVFLAQTLTRPEGVGGTGNVVALGVGGTGKVATLGVGGTGNVALGVGGTGNATAGVGGTGKVATLGVGGTGNVALGVGGTGNATAGVGGTGKVATLGVGGTGNVALGVGGTGNATAGVGGTGKVVTLGVGGTGNVALGVGGTGNATAGVGGTGKVATLGVGGTGNAALGVGGTGNATAGVGGTGKVTTLGVGGTGN
jgi:hypothetical protein